VTFYIFPLKIWRFKLLSRRYIIVVIADTCNSDFNVRKSMQFTVYIYEEDLALESCKWEIWSKLWSPLGLPEGRVNSPDI